MTEQLALYPVAELENLVLVISQNDRANLENGNLMLISGVVIDLLSKNMSEPLPLDLHLKKNPWKEIESPDRRENVLRQISQIIDPATALGLFARDAGSVDKTG